MADLRIKTGVNLPDRQGADRAYAAVRALRDGSISVADFLLICALEGRTHIANVGSVTTPITFGAGTIDITEPDFDLSVPADTLVIPVEINVYMEAFGTSAQFECMAAVGRGGVIASTGTALIAPAGLVNQRLDAPYASKCSAKYAADAASATYMTDNVYEFWRDGAQFAITKTAGSATVAATDPNKFSWRLTDSMVPPIMYSKSGICRLNVFAASQAGTGFMTIKYAELPGADIG